ncbi:MAG: CDP-alcohol phosphatidyltransferase [Frankiales bacterium]|jgi:CDP-diacylglycerol--glycerol-3-phosphate 3-phosphatidyltransferase|nr:CDP-alcohol phosphatidyltransferase [Frankiales bacterium]
MAEQVAPTSQPTSGGRGSASAAVPQEDLAWRVWTIPNILSLLRLAGVPVFLYWTLETQQDGRAILLLMAAGASDYFDGLIARRFDSFSRLGKLLDPLADRLYIFATVLALVARDGLPLWWALALIGRDVALTASLPLLRRAGHGPLPVNYLGKAATFNLLYAFPMLLAALPENDGLLAEVFRPLGWAFATWGSLLYMWAGVLYLVQVRRLLRAGAT